MPKNEIVAIEKNENKFYTKMKKFFAGLFRRLLRIKVVNPENEPIDTNYIVCCNHTALLDVVVIAAGLKRQVRFMAKKEVFKVPILNWFIKSMGAFPVDRKGGDVGAIKKTIEILNSGSCVGVFPQGTRCRGKALEDTKFKNGAALVLSKTNVPVLPVRVKVKNNKWYPFRKIEIVIGEKIEVDLLKIDPEKNKSEEMARITNVIFERIKGL